MLFSSISAFAAPSTWAVDEVELAKQLGLTTPAILSDFQSPITREEFSEMIIKLYEELSGKIATPAEVNLFSDTSNPEILKANRLGIVQGFPGGIFAPSSLITREQIATMYYRTLLSIDQLIVAGTFNIGFADKGLISSWAMKEVSFMSAKGVIQGRGGNMFDPKGNTTREEAIALTVRTYQQFSKNPVQVPTQGTGMKLTSEQIGALSDRVVQIFVEHFDGTYTTGSGFFYEKARIATNFHVIENAKNITLEYENGSTYTGGITVTGYNRDIDIATLMVSDLTTPSLVLGDSSTIVKGQKVYAIGSPVGLTNSLSDGLVSAVRSDVFQITTAINPGNSGGALLDEYGRAIGITFARISDGDNLGFAIPINLLKSMEKNRLLSLEQFNVEIKSTIVDSTDEMTTYEIIDHLYDNMQSIVANDKTISFDGYDAVKSPDGTMTNIYAYVTETNLDRFLEAEKIGIINIAKQLKVHAEFYEEIIGTDIRIEVLYYGVYDEYPHFFEENYITDDTIAYVGYWEVLYPLIAVTNTSKQFDSWYSSHTM